MIMTMMLRPFSAGCRAGRPIRSLIKQQQQQQQQQQQSGHRQQLLVQQQQPPSHYSSHSSLLSLTTRPPSPLMTPCAVFQPQRLQQKQTRQSSSLVVVQTAAPTAALSPPSAPVFLPDVAAGAGLALKRNGRVCLSTTTASSPSSSSSSSTNSKSESGDNTSNNTSNTNSNNSNTNTNSNSSNSNLILDHLGTIFLTAIALVITTLVRSYYGTARKNALRDQLEADAALDPLEIQELRLANSRLTVAVFRNVMEQLWNKKTTCLEEHQQQQQDPADVVSAVVPTMTYSEFCLAVREILQTQHHSDENPIPTIELGHYLDRVVLKLLLQQEKQYMLQNQNQSSATATATVAAASETPQSLTLWLIVLSLALSAPTPDRIQVLYEILQREAMATRCHLDLDTSSSSNTNPIVTVAQVQQLVGYLQSTCQLVIDNQLLPTPDKKYPIQNYHQGSPQELVQWPSQGGGDGKQEDDKENETSRRQNEETIDVDALAAILRSKSVCAWGECYHKKRML